MFFADLVLLGIWGYDVILGMDWLTKYQATINCKRKTLTVVTSEGETLTYGGSDNILTVSLIFATRAYNLVKKGCPAFLCAVELTEASDLEPKDIPVVQNFPEVFQEMPGLAPEGKIEFAIELVPGTSPISKAPYRMAPSELTELKTQLHKLLDKGLIQPSVSPWGSPSFICEEEGWEFAIVYLLS